MDEGKKEDSLKDIHMTECSPKKGKLKPSLSVPAGHFDPYADKYIIYRDTSKLSCSPNYLEGIMSEPMNDKNRAFAIFFKRHTSYDLIPSSSKLVVFDTELNVKKAFFALVYNGVRAAHLWDSSIQSFIGMLTITDFIRVLHHFHSNGSHFDELENHKISKWRSLVDIYKRPLISIKPESSLSEAIKTLLRTKVHRLPIIDQKSGNPLYILTHKRILKFLHINIDKLPTPDCMYNSLEELAIGTYKNVATIHTSTPLSEALSIFINRSVSALPVVDDNGNLVDIYSKFDVINLAATRTYDDLSVSVFEALAYRRQNSNWTFEGVATCNKSDSLMTVFDRLANAGVHRLVMVDSDKHVEGIVSLSDILGFIARI